MVSVPIWIESAENEEISIVRMDLTFDGNALAVPTMVIGEAGADADKELSFSELENGVLRIFIVGLSNNTDRLEEAYTIELLPPADPKRGGASLLLLPKQKEGEEPLFERIILQLEPKHFLPTQIHIVNDEESEVVYTLDEFTINKPLDIEETHILLPEGT